MAGGALRLGLVAVLMRVSMTRCGGAGAAVAARTWGVTGSASSATESARRSSSKALPHLAALGPSGTAGLGLENVGRETPYLLAFRVEELLRRLQAIRTNSRTGELSSSYRSIRWTMFRWLRRTRTCSTKGRRRAPLPHCRHRPARSIAASSSSRRNWRATWTSILAGNLGWLKEGFHLGSSCRAAG